MRDKARSKLADVVQGATRPLISGVRDDLDHLAAALADVGKLVEVVQPVTVELDEALADRIVEKIHGPLTIPQAFSDWIADQAKHSNLLMTYMVGYGPNTCQIYMTMSSNWTLMLEFRDMNGAPLWLGTFVPPGFGKVNDDNHR